jgi:hypothetical protein
MDDAAAAVNLVGSVVRLVPAIKNATRSVSVPGARGLGGLGGLGSTTTTTNAPIHPAPPRVDPERERRAYETVNYVLRTLGSRIGEAGLVSASALAKALTEATMSIDVKLFSIQTNRLFESLASKLNDPILVNSVFTSIYLISFLTAELQGSLPNYKDTYTPLGPRLVQQLFMAAIGEDAFRENQTANLDAYQTLARTAGLLRPTDLERATFPGNLFRSIKRMLLTSGPGFPSFRPCRYSSKTFKDTRNNRMNYERLVKHFDMYGFPQPLQGRDVGAIRDWRFLSGDSNTRAFEVEKADKHIGENFGRVLHWLICSADRMPPGEAVVAYLDQHIELIKWMGPRMGYRAISAATDMEMVGPHAVLRKELREVFNTWIILMPSESAKATRRKSSAQWAQSQQRPVSLPQTSYTSSLNRTPSIGTPISPVGSNVQPMPNIRSGSVSSGHTHMSPTIPEEANKPLVRPAAMPSPQSVPVSAAGAPPNISQRPAPMVTPAMTSPTPQPSVMPMGSPPIHPPAPAPVASPLSSDISKPPIHSQSISPGVSPPPYSPYSSPPPATTYPFPAVPRPTSVVRRKAPPRPKKKLILAKALDDFEPEDDNDEELPFKEGDVLEIVEKSAALEEEGWCRARLKDGQRIGLAPLEYLEELGPEALQALGIQPISTGQGKPPISATPSITIPGTVHELPGSHVMNPSNLNTSPGQVHDLAPAAHSLPNSAQAASPPVTGSAPSQVSPSQGDGNSPSAATSQSNSPNMNTLPLSSQHTESPSHGGLSGVGRGIAQAEANPPHVSARISAHNIGHYGPSNASSYTTSHPGSAQAHSSRPPGNAGKPPRQASAASGRPPAQSSQAGQNMAAKISGVLQNVAALSGKRPAALGPTLNISHQSGNNAQADGSYTSPPQGSLYGGPPTSNYGPTYSNVMPMPGYSMAPQTMYGPPVDQSAYNNNSGNDMMMQMLAMQTVAGMAQPAAAPVASPATIDTNSYNDPLTTLGGNSADPGLTLSGTATNSFGTQKAVDTTGTDSIADTTANSGTDPNTDPSTLAFSPPATDLSGLSIQSPPADPSSLSVPPPVVDSSTIIMSNPAADVAAIDPFYAQMNPDLTSPNIAVDSISGMVSPLASLSPMPPPMDPSAAGITSVASGYGTDPTMSPLAGLMPDPNATASSAAVDGTYTGGVVVEETTIVEQDTTVVDDYGTTTDQQFIGDDYGTTTDQQFVDDEVGYVMDATACSEEWVV